MPKKPKLAYYVFIAKLEAVEDYGPFFPGDLVTIVNNWDKYGEDSPFDKELVTQISLVEFRLRELNGAKVSHLPI